MILPYATGPAGQWTLYDYGRRFANADAPADATGTAIATIGTPATDELWMVDLVRVKTSGADVTSTAYVCVGDPAYDIVGTQTGAYDVADQAAAIQVPAGSPLLIVWRDVPPGLLPNCYVQWTVLKSTATLGV